MVDGWSGSGGTVQENGQVCKHASEGICMTRGLNVGKGEE